MDKMKLKLSEKLGYGCGDFASSMFWKLFSMFLMFFYTDVFGLSAATVGTMFLITRVWDALVDPVVGMVADRTNSKWGKFRPYLLFVAVPFAIFGVLTFTTPELGNTGKVIYAYVTYTLMMMVYSTINVPYSSLMGVMTDDLGERTSLASFRFIGAFAGGLLVSSTANYLVDLFGGKSTGAINYAAGYRSTVTVFAIIAAAFFLLTFLLTKERLKPSKEKSGSFKDDLKDLAKNDPWFIMLGVGTSILIFNSLRDGTIMYYFKYYVKDQSISVFGSTYDLSLKFMASAYLSIWLGTNIIGVILAKPISTIIGKKGAFMLSIISSAVLSFLFYFLKPGDIKLIFLLNIFIGISAGIVLPLIWSMFADIADYSEWKNGRRATGLIFSSSSMSQKFGWTLGGALTGWLLASFGFQANVEQSVNSLTGIRLMISIIAGLGAIMAGVFLLFYRLDEKYMVQVQEELRTKRGN